MQSSTHHFEAFRRWLMVRNYAKATQRAYLRVCNLLAFPAGVFCPKSVPTLRSFEV